MIYDLAWKEQYFQCKVSMGPSLYVIIDKKAQLNWHMKIVEFKALSGRTSFAFSFSAEIGAIEARNTDFIGS